MGPKGDTGPAGAQGPQGPQGPVGPQGSTLSVYDAKNQYLGILIDNRPPVSDVVNFEVGVGVIYDPVSSKFFYWPLCNPDQTGYCWYDGEFSLFFIEPTCSSQAFIAVCREDSGISGLTSDALICGTPVEAFAFYNKNGRFYTTTGQPILLSIGNLYSLINNQCKQIYASSRPYYFYLASEVTMGFNLPVTYPLQFRLK
jgi:hypothetical protein